MKKIKDEAPPDDEPAEPSELDRMRDLTRRVVQVPKEQVPKVEPKKRGGH